MSDYRLDVFFKNFSKLGGSVISFRQPFWILPVPDQCVTANLHVVPGCEIHNLVALRKIERLRLRMHYLPLQGVFRFQHIELAGERGCVCGLVEMSWPYRSADKQSRTLRGVTQRLLSDSSAKSQAKGCGRPNKNQHLPFHGITARRHP